MKPDRLSFRLLFTLLFSSFVAGASWAAGFEEGAAYEKVVPAQPTAHQDQVEVVEVFWYGCPHCHRFQPYLERWLDEHSEGIDYVRLPAVLRESWAIHARAYYTAEALGVVDKIHADLFDAIHNDNRRIDTEESLMAFFAERGVDEEAFRRTFHSFAVDSKIRRARLLTRRYGVSGTPAVVVNGKFRTGPVMAGSYDNLTTIMSYLVSEEQRSQEN